MRGEVFGRRGLTIWFFLLTGLSAPSVCDAQSRPASIQPASPQQQIGRERTAGVAAPLVRPAAPQDAPVIVHTDLVSLTVTVTDAYGRYVSGLGKDAFTLFDEKVEQEIAFFSDEDAPASVGVVVDLSGSMSGDKIVAAREALRRFIDTSHVRDEYFLIGFNQRARLLVDRTRDPDRLLDGLTFVPTKGQTAVYDAAYLGIERVTRGSHKKRAVLLISDGQDNSSRYRLKELREYLKESDVIVYAVGIVGAHEAGQWEAWRGRATLEELAAVSGGKAFFPQTSAEMYDVFERIAVELRHQYSIAYRPSNFANDGRWHKIKVKVKKLRGLPRLFVRSRGGYYASARPR